MTADSSGEGMGFRVVAADNRRRRRRRRGRHRQPPQATGRTLDVCPTDYGSFPENAPQLTCGCDAASVKKGKVCGANPY